MKQIPFSYSASGRSIDFLPGVYMDYPTSSAVINGECWVFYVHGDAYSPASNIIRYKSTDFENMERQPDGIMITDGSSSNHFGCGAWYDVSASAIYVLSHAEYHHDLSMSGAGWSKKKTRLYKSTDLGLTWTFMGDIATSYLGDPGEWSESSGTNFEMGPADFSFYADELEGYFYIYCWNGFVAKHGLMRKTETYTEVMRCAISDRMAPGKWYKYRDGEWKEPALGGIATPLRFPTYGLYGNIIYSTYLERYLLIGTSNGVGDPRFPAVSLSDGSIYICSCTSLTLQDWTHAAKLIDEPSNMLAGHTLTDDSGTNYTRCGQTMRLYNYWIKERRAFDITFDKNGTISAVGFPKYPAYSYERIPESADGIASRQTRIVGSKSSEMTYNGDGWSTEANENSYEGCYRISGTANDSVEFSFSGADVYWRAVFSSDSGRADVYIDNTFCETVDCYFSDNAQVGHFAFIKKGLEPGFHVVRVVVKGEKNERSSGTNIRHIAFEYSADSFRASAGFTSVQGKNNWHYQYWNGSEYVNLPIFKRLEGHPKAHWYFNCWQGYKEIDKIGSNYSCGSVVRTWVAPHSGFVRIDGVASIGAADNETRVLWDPCVTYVATMQSDSISSNEKSQDNVLSDNSQEYELKIDRNSFDLLNLKLAQGQAPIMHTIYAKVNSADCIHFRAIVL